MYDQGGEQGRSQLFLLRVWPDGDSDRNGEWSARLQHVFSGETRTFRACPQLVDVLLGLSSGREPEQIEPDDIDCP